MLNYTKPTPNLNRQTMWIDDLTFNADGLIPAIAQDRDTGKILMLAWQNREALLLTAQTGTGVYFSRSRGKLWHKGETSGHQQIVHEIRTDCDSDAIILIVTQVGGIACHTGRESCFYRTLDTNAGTWYNTSEPLKSAKEIYGTQVKHEHTPRPSAHSILSQLDTLLQERKGADKDSSYVASLYHKGLNKILEKVGEEAVESILAAKELQLVLATGQGEQTHTAQADLIYEMADLWFHSLVALAHLDLSSEAVLSELARRFGLSGIDEKNSRTNK